MKIRRITILSLLVVGSILLAACSAATGTADDDVLTVIQLVNGTLGDKSFTDSAHHGLVQASEEFGFVHIVNEAGPDLAKWEPAFMDALLDPDIDVLITGSGDMMDILVENAPLYPEKYFIMFDNPVDFEDAISECDNVYAIQYMQNEIWNSFTRGG